VITTDTSSQSTTPTALNLSWQAAWNSVTMTYDGHYLTVTMENSIIFRQAVIVAGTLYPLTLNRTTFNFSYTDTNNTTQAVLANIKDLKVFSSLIQFTTSYKMFRNTFTSSTPNLIS
jgi:hypothetical protein